MHNAPSASVYLSAAFSRRREMVALARALREWGYQVTSSWINDRESSDSRDHKRWLRLLSDLTKSDIFLLVGPNVGARGWVELGLARAAGLRIITVGLRNSQHFMLAGGSETYDNMESASRTLRRLVNVMYRRLNKEIKRTYEQPED